VLALLRGDHALSETKFATAVGATEIRPAHPEELRESLGADAGSLGPLGVKNMRIIADEALKGRRNMICGANRNDFHLKNVTPCKDFHPEFADIRQVAAGDTSIDGGEPLAITKSVEIGHIFKLGYKYSDAMGLRVLDENGKEVTPIMGSYGIGIERILTCAVELYHDADGMALPPAISPFTVVITPANLKDAAQRECAERLYHECKQLNLDVLLDDRDERPGVKFKDADLIGIPYRITIGKKLAQGMVEVVERRPKKTTDVAAADAARHVATQVETAV
jgi:prolyl-tRNA synthetase